MTMENSTVNSLSSYGYDKRDEIDRGGKIDLRRKTRKSEKRAWMREVEEEMTDEG